MMDSVGVPGVLNGAAAITAAGRTVELQLFGHNARLMPAKYVRPYSKGQKNDYGCRRTARSPNGIGSERRLRLRCARR